MTLYEKIIKIYPQLKIDDFLETIQLQNDGNELGDYIAIWNHKTLPCPTKEQLENL